MFNNIVDSTTFNTANQQRIQVYANLESSIILKTGIRNVYYKSVLYTQTETYSSINSEAKCYSYSEYKCKYTSYQYFSSGLYSNTYESDARYYTQLT